MVLAATTASAQLKTSYFMRGSTYRYDMNPALTPIRGYIKLPGLSGLSMEMNNNIFGLDRFLYNKNGETVTFMHSSVSSEEFLKKFKKDNSLNFDVNLPVLGFGDYSKHVFWSFDVSARVMAGVSVPRDLFRMIKALGTTCEIGNLRLDANGYLQTSLGFTFPIGKHVMTGFKVKGLVGLFHATANIDEFTFAFKDDKVSAAGHAYIDGSVSGFDLGIGKPGDKYRFQLTGNQDNTTSGNEMPDFGKEISDRLNVNNFSPSNLSKGIGFDLGVEANLLKDHIHLSASVVDLGWIWYKNGLSASSNRLTCSFEGTNLSNLINNGGEIDINTVLKHNLNEIVITNNGSKTNVSRLATQLNVGAEFGVLRNHISVGILSHSKFYESHTYSELTASLNLRAGKWLTASFSHSFLNSGLQSIGFALNLHPKAFNIFFGTDYIPLSYARIPINMGEDAGPIGNLLAKGIPVPVDNFGFTAYMGVSLQLHQAHFGKRQKEVRQERRDARRAQREGNAESLYDDDEPTEKESKKESKKDNKEE